MLKKENGVTLVALVITIIVLLILAGVVLAMVMGDSGIFGKANKSKIATNLSSAKDAINLAILEATADQYDNDGHLVTAKLFTDTAADNFTLINNQLNGYAINTSTGEVSKGSTYNAAQAVKDSNDEILTVTLHPNTVKHSMTATWGNDVIGE